MAACTELAVALDDLSSRFFLNLPKEELRSFERLFFQLEQAWWFYEDFYREKQPYSLPKFSFRDFCLCLFEQSPALTPHVPNFELHFSKFKDYLGKVPVCGAILLDETMTYCVLVKGWNSRSWGFPKGKINQGELNIDCAVREVFEETGYDIGALVSDRHMLQAVLKGKSTNLYIAPNVPIDTLFLTQTRKEIAEIHWFRIETIDDDNRFWNVKPFLYKLKTWICRHRHLANKSIPLNVRIVANDFQRRCHSQPAITKQRLKKKEKRLNVIMQQTIQRRINTSGVNIANGSTDRITFGCDDTSWSPEEMFAQNERLFGVQTTTYSDPNELSALMADNGTMTGSIQFRLARTTLQKLIHISPPPIVLPAPPPSDRGRTETISEPMQFSHEGPSSVNSGNVLLNFELADPSDRIGRTANLPMKPCCGDSSALSSGNALLNFQLDDSVIMSHFFQA